MKLLWISEEIELKEKLKDFWDHYDIDLIFYQNSRKAIDNLDEIDPQAVVFNGVDFPRQWKVALSLIRDKHDYKKSIFILLKDRNFAPEDAMKASWLGANGLVDLDDIEQGDYKGLLEILQRYLPIKKKPEYFQGELVFLTPQSNRLCSGTILFHDKVHCSFRPQDPMTLINCQPGQVIHDGSLKINRQIERADFIITANKGLLQMSRILPVDAPAEGSEIMEFQLN